MFDVDDILAFDREAQSVLEMRMPAEILLPGQSTPIRCAGGNVRFTDLKFEDGGSVKSYDANFRVLRSRLAPVVLELGNCFKWRNVGEVEWRGMVRIFRIADLPQSAAIGFGCGNPEQ